MNLTLSFGEWRLGEPDLDGWSEILGALEDGDYQVLAAAAAFMLGVPPATWGAGSKETFAAATGLAQIVMPVVKRSPSLGIAVLQACLWGTRGDGGPRHPSQQQARYASLGDLLDVCTSLVESGVLTDLLDQVKNRLGPVLNRLAGPAEEPIPGGA